MFVRIANPLGPSFLVNTAAITWVQLVSGARGVEQVNIHFAGGAPLCLAASDDLLDALDELTLPGPAADQSPPRRVPPLPPPAPPLAVELEDTLESTGVLTLGPGQRTSR